MANLEKLPEAPEPKALLDEETKVEATPPATDATEKPSTVEGTPAAEDTPIKIEYEPTSASDKTASESDLSSTSETSNADEAEKTPEGEKKPSWIETIKGIFGSKEEDQDK